MFLSMNCWSAGEGSLNSAPVGRRGQDRGTLRNKSRWAELTLALQSLCFRAVTVWPATWQLSGATIFLGRTVISMWL